MRHAPLNSSVATILIGAAVIGVANSLFDLPRFVLITAAVLIGSIVISLEIERFHRSSAGDA